MKQETKKKGNAKNFSIGIIMVLALALGTAMLVPYLSNTSTHSVSVESPISISEFDGDISAYGGETKSLEVMFENLADAEITGRVEIVLSSYMISLDDFKSVEADFSDYSEGTWALEDIDLLSEGEIIESVVIEGNKIIITTYNQVWQPTRTWEADMDMTFEDNVVGNYNIAVKVIPSN